jgi:uncharacterized protein
MSTATAQKILDFIFRHAPSGRDIEIGFFGGEPLLEFELIQAIVNLIERYPSNNEGRVSLTLTTNGTIFSDSIAHFLKAHAIKFCVSCDGPPHVQNVFRRSAEGKDTGAIVEETLKAAQVVLPAVLVNAVYHPRTFRHLPETVDYLSRLGLRQIYLNPDFSAPWTRTEADALPDVYRSLGQRYIAWYQCGDPHFISIIDGKIAVLLRGGYHPLERCQMGNGEMAFTPDGGIYPCERLIGSGINGIHRIGHLDQGLDLTRLSCRMAPGSRVNLECTDCSLKDCCMNWCGCSNVFMTGYYNRVGPFLCASERAAIQIAFEVLAILNKQLGPVFLHHLAGAPQLNSRLSQGGLYENLTFSAAKEPQPQLTEKSR